MFAPGTPGLGGRGPVGSLLLLPALEIVANAPLKAFEALLRQLVRPGCEGGPVWEAALQGQLAGALSADLRRALEVRLPCCFLWSLPMWFVFCAEHTIALYTVETRTMAVHSVRMHTMAMHATAMHNTGSAHSGLHASCP